jgi:hypothetical protein
MIGAQSSPASNWQDDLGGKEDAHDLPWTHQSYIMAVHMPGKSHSVIPHRGAAACHYCLRRVALGREEGFVARTHGTFSLAGLVHALELVLAGVGDAHAAQFPSDDALLLWWPEEAHTVAMVPVWELQPILKDPTETGTKGVMSSQGLLEGRPSARSQHRHLLASCWTPS